jgi:hypothetical protein
MRFREQSLCKNASKQKSDSWSFKVEAYYLLDRRYAHLSYIGSTQWRSLIEWRERVFTWFPGNEECVFATFWPD